MYEQKITNGQFVTKFTQYQLRVLQLTTTTLTAPSAQCCSVISHCMSQVVSKMLFHFIISHKTHVNSYSEQQITVSALLAAENTYNYTGRGRSRARNVRDRDGHRTRKKWGPAHLRRSKGTARRAEPTFGLCFLPKAPKEGESTSPFFVAYDQKRRILCPIVLPQGVPKGTNTSYCRRLSSFEHSFPANRITTFSCADTVRNCWKIIKNGRFLENRKQKYGGNMRNQFFDRNFLFDFYSVRGSTGTLLAVLM